MTAPAASPDVENLSVFTGKVTFDLNDMASPRDLGEAQLFKLTPALTKLDYFSKRNGSKKKVKSVITEQAVTLNMELNEMTDTNLAMALMGTSVGGTFGLLSQSEIVGTIVFDGTNNVGNLVHWEGRVSISPKDGIDFLGDGWGVITIEAEVLADESTGEFGVMTVSAQA